MSLFVLIFLSFFSLSYGYDVPTDCIECAQKTPEILSKLTEPFSRLMFLENKATNLVKTHEYLIKDLMPIARTLRDGKSEPTFEASTQEIKEIKADFDRLTLLQKETLILQKKFNLCLFNCGPMMKLELQDKIEAMQKVKASLLIKRPILANRAFEKRLTDLTDKDLENANVFPQKVFESDLKDAAFDLLASLDKRKTAVQKFLDDGNKPLVKTGNETYTAEYLEKVTSRFPELIEDSLNVTFNGPSSTAEKNTACYFAQKFKSYSDIKKRVEIAVDVSLIVLPMLTGPIGFEASMAARLAGWGIKAAEFKNLSIGASFALQAGIIAKDRQALSRLKNDCANKEIRLFSESSQQALTELKECNEKYGEQLFMANLSLLPTGYSLLKSIPLRGPPAAAFTTKSASSANDIARDIYSNGLKSTVEFKTPDKGVFTIMDLSTAKDPAMKKISEDYWRYVGNVYNERLNLTPTEIDNFIKSSMEMSPRTKLILNTEKSAFEGNMKIKGGVGIVSAKSQELLPLEKATGVRIQKKPGEKIAEIVRLTVGKENDAVELSGSLIAQASSILAKDKEVNRVFIFTSKIHGRLYRRMGVPAGNIKTLDDRDVLIELNREEVEAFARAKITN
jgi:hypothetical protein